MIHHLDAPRNRRERIRGEQRQLLALEQRLRGNAPEKLVPYADDQTALLRVLDECGDHLGISGLGDPGYANPALDPDCPLILDQFVCAHRFLALLEPGKRATQHSYTLKHLAEFWGSIRFCDRFGYVSNGALIAAAIDLGLTVRAVRPPNALIGVRGSTFLRTVEEAYRAGS